MNYILAYVFSIIGGFVITGPLVVFMRKTSGVSSGKEGNDYNFAKMYSWSLLLLGGTERGIATTLFMFAPTQLPVFVADWSAAKIAAGWGRVSDVKYAAAHMTALVGTAWSFCFAIAAGYWACPISLVKLAGP